MIESTIDPWQAFQLSDTLGRLRMVADPQRRALLQPLLGDDAVAVYLALAADVDLDARPHLAGDGPSLVFVPGVMGSLLMSSGMGGMWWIDARSRNHLNDLGLGDDGVSDALVAARIEPATVDCSYEGFLVAAANRDFAIRPVPYDWRKSLSASAVRVRDAVVAERERSGGEPVHLVAHSMGGLLVRETLRQHPELWDLVGEVVFIGTPHYGAPAITVYVKNHFWGAHLMILLGRYITRTVLRSMAGVLQLLPAPLGVYPGTRDLTVGSAGYPHPCVNFDLYDADAYGLRMTDRDSVALQRGLTGAAQFHRRLAAAHLELDQSLRDRMTIIAGIGMKTAFSTRFERKVFKDRLTIETSRRARDPDRDGDGRVPLRSAELEHVNAVHYVRGKHGALPNIKAVYEDVFRKVTGEALLLPTSPAAALAAHLGDDESDVTAALTDPTPDTADPEDPGYLDFDGPDEATIDELDRRLADGALPWFTRIHLL